MTLGTMGRERVRVVPIEPQSGLPRSFAGLRQSRARSRAAGERVTIVGESRADVEVVGPNTGANIAGVADVGRVIEDDAREHERHTMNTEKPATLSAFTDRSISASGYRASPEPAVVRLFDLLPEPLRERPRAADGEPRALRTLGGVL
jgi:hypothetical protein